MKNVLVSAAKSTFPTLSKIFSKASCTLGLAAVVGVSVLTGVVGAFSMIAFDGSQPLSVVFMMAATVLAYGVVLFVPAISLGAKRGWKAGVSVIVSEIIWMAIFAITLSYLFPSPTFID